MSQFQSLEINELNLENKGSIGRDHTAGTALSIGVVRGAGDEALSALVELLEALVPASDDLADANGELEGSAALH